jgi:hypothetical protein
MKAALLSAAFESMRSILQKEISDDALCSLLVMVCILAKGFGDVFNTRIP